MVPRRVRDAGRRSAARPSLAAGGRRRVPRRAGTAALAALALVAALLTPAVAYPRPGTVERVSVTSDGAQANGPSFTPAISADGRHVAFDSYSPDLVPGDTNGTSDIFVHDRQTRTTERVSVSSDGTQGNGDSYVPTISADGRYVAFSSFSSNLVPDDGNRAFDVFVHDRQTRTTERVSVSSDGTEGNALSYFAAISADGREVAFASQASNLVPDATNDAWDVFVHDRETGTTERVSMAPDGAEANGASQAPAISADGRHVAFESLASNLVPDDGNRQWDIFVHDRETGTTERVSMSSDGAEGNGWSAFAAISADGRHVAFDSWASNLVPDDTNEGPDVFVHDRETGTTERVSVASDGAEGNSGSLLPAISADGRHVAFHSNASNFAPDDTNETPDAFVHDRETGTTERVSIASDGAEGNNWSLFTAISAEGSHVAFSSEASNLVPGDTNGTFDVFARDRGPATGVGALEVGQAPGELTVSGWARFSGATVASVEDPEDDGVDLVGAEIVGASVIHRPELDDLLLRMDLASLPGPAGACLPAVVCQGASTGGGRPAVVYRWSFDAGGAAYEIRALAAAATASPPTAGPHFALYRCALECTETTRLSGGIGTTGAAVRLSVPLEALGAEVGTVLTALEASTALGEASTGALEVLDDVELPEATIPAPQVTLGIAPTGTPADKVAFDAGAALTDGLFSGAVDTSSLPPGDYEAWARACLGDTCGARSVSVSL